MGLSWYTMGLSWYTMELSWCTPHAPDKKNQSAGAGGQPGMRAGFALKPGRGGTHFDVFLMGAWGVGGTPAQLHGIPAQPHGIPAQPQGLSRS